MQKGKFFTSNNIQKENLEGYKVGWHSKPSVTKTEHLIVIEVEFDPAGGHNFHLHPNQEEVIYVVQGTIEQWINTEKKHLNPGESAYIPAGVVHASFNNSQQQAKVIAILGPSTGEEGYELEDVFDQVPWKNLRNK